MNEELRTFMRAVEAAPTAPVVEAEPIRFAGLAGLGSKYLAVGTPESIGLIGVADHEEALVACHTLLFGPLASLRSADVGVEEAMAADIACLTSDCEFELDWIAEATHLNILDTGTWSESMNELARATSLTYLRTRDAALPTHGLLADVISGSVSGRMGEETTALVV